MDFLFGIKSEEDGEALELGEMFGTEKAETKLGEGQHLGDGQGGGGVDEVAGTRVD